MGAQVWRKISLVSPMPSTMNGYPSAPQAAPTLGIHTFAPIEQNEPWLSSAIAKAANLNWSCVTAGIQTVASSSADSPQGACLATESVARHPAHHGALIAFTGGLVGPDPRTSSRRVAGRNSGIAQVQVIPIRMCPGLVSRPQLAN